VNNYIGKCSRIPQAFSSCAACGKTSKEGLAKKFSMNPIDPGGKRSFH
jgi:hypothetical protein